MAEKNEKPTKFFFSLEKERGEEKQLRELQDENGAILNNKDEIISHIYEYYQSKFTKEDTDPVTMETLIRTCERKLTDEENAPLNELFTIKELSRVRHGMKNGKSPGLMV